MRDCQVDTFIVALVIIGFIIIVLDKLLPLKNWDDDDDDDLSV
jgi:hypothetical protein